MVPLDNHRVPPPGGTPAQDDHRAGTAGQTEDKGGGPCRHRDRAPSSSILVTDRAVAHRALVQHSAGFLDRPRGAVVSSILTRHRHWNVVSAPYGPYWRAARRNMVAGVLLPARVRRRSDARARALSGLVRALRAGDPIGESLHLAVFRLQAELCFGEEVVSSLGEARIRAMKQIQRDIQLALPSFRVLVSSGVTVKFLIDDIGRDPAVWSDPMAFIPERFMPGGEGEAADLTCTRDLKMMPFGAGRRICPGIALAILYVEYFVANMVREFEWREVDGQEVDLAESPGFLFTTMKHPLRGCLVPRDAEAVLVN
ncbi:hypothetical protein QOZ80_4BG0347520 [Eleusine coracana subsp. coracana]|nr:hypothetical protein QOZ80_4BG0347520 [Eleusine coracana subsp. coracana]